MKFLITDDSKISRMKLSSIITELGYEVVGFAVDGEDAIEKYKQLSPDFITMDLEMPKKRGNIAASEILEINPHVNIIMITSIVNKSELLNIMKMGVKKVLQKPVTKEKLALTIDELNIKD